MAYMFQKNHRVRSSDLLTVLIQKRGRQCECCKLTTWLNQPINLQVHHIDGDRTNNCLDNLQLLCLNCHSYTDTFGIKNHKQPTVSDEKFVAALQSAPSIRQALFNLSLSDAGGNYKRARALCTQYNIVFPVAEKENYCKTCGKPILVTSTYCNECAAIASRVVPRPDRETLKQEIRNIPFTQLSLKYKVSDKAIVKWCIHYGLPSKKSEIRQYTDDEWEQI